MIDILKLNKRYFVHILEEADVEMLVEICRNLREEIVTRQQK